MDRLRSPGGCPWDAEQTHRSLVPYAIEEAYELAEAVEADDRAGLREELGDLLLQVVFHARLAQEDPDEPFDVDDVAAD
ncbi:MAG TPA: MazG nucleotide pyrophosphohydrolase domain-containing protein, partial [Cellulomonas sp.]|nr:MazG nucleotide pyrophosphohydrolase domain-containing protein [Cellulomonas sp.]